MPAARGPRRRESQLAFEALSIEGGLLSPDWLSRVGQLSAGMQSEADYRVPKGLNLRDEIGRYWRIAQANWREFDAGRSAGAAARALAEQFVLGLLRDSFGFDSLAATAPVVVADRTYPLGFSGLSGRVPVVIAPAGSGVDTLATSFGDGGRRRSAFGLAQEFLNATADATWGLVSDGLTLRIVRDNASLTRPAWLEADLERIFTEGRYADFAALWLLAHQTRFGKPGQTAGEGTLEAWRAAGREEGTRAREHLRKSVEDAVISLGQGFLSHPDNRSLQTALRDGSLTKTAYFQQLLRLVYRLIFLLTVEERGLLHPEQSSEAARELYAEGYGMKRLRDRSVKRSAHDRFSDLWEATKIVFRGVANGEPRLALPALAGLFDTMQCPSLDASKIENHALLLAVFRLSWLREGAGLSRVNWRDMGPEELGSVYEGLLELQPQITQSGRVFGFATGGEAKGHARKTTGSYYTHDSLVQVLLDSALEPVVQSTMAAHPQNAVQALLELAIVDPACGSGHFLLAAARRLAAHVARIQANGTPSAAEYRRALRQVMGRCIYGVDLNPMAVELCKVSLWMEAVEPGLPLTFLNSHIQQGNALLGTTPALMENGVPDAAWDPIEGDDKKVASALKKRNKKAAAGQRGLSSVWSEPGENESAAIARAVAALEAASDADVGALARKESQWEGILDSDAYRHQRFVADAWCAAFVWPKQSGPLADAAPTNELWRQIRDGQGRPPALTVKTIGELATKYNFFNWHLAFPRVFTRGGFDVVLGNPPWERLKFLEEEFFAGRDDHVAAASNTAERRRRITDLAGRDARLYGEFSESKRLSEGISSFIQNSGRFPLTGQGDINTYAIFAEANRVLVRDLGRAGFIVQSEIATSETYKDFFASLLAGRQLVSLYDFVNTEGLFPGLHRTHPHFCLVTLGPVGSTNWADLAFWNTNVAQLQDADRHFTLSFSDLEMINPETRTCAVFRNRRDAAITVSLHRAVPSLGAQQSDGDWQADIFQKMIDATIHADLISFTTDPPSSEWLGVYEGRMVQAFNHRFATYDGVSTAERESGNPRPASASELTDPNFAAKAACWISPRTYAERVAQRPSRFRWFVSMRYVSNTTNERTVICCVRPYVPSNNKLVSVLLARDPIEQAAFVANMSSIPLDYVARQKLGGTTLAGYIVRQLPVIPAHNYSLPAAWTRQSLGSWIALRALELTYTAWDLEPFARDIGYVGPPFRWNPDRRFLLRAELDAAFFHLYGLSHDDTAYVLDTFPIVRKNDEKVHGEYRTKRVILEIYDRLAEATTSGRPYATLLDPAPADPQVAHAPRAVAFNIPPMPAVVPVLKPDEETAVTIWAILHASGGTITRMDLARSFALRSQPAVLSKLAPPVLGEIARAWVDKVGTRTVASGSLARVLKTLAERDGVKLTTDASSRSVVTMGTGTQPEDRIAPWFQFEARLALQVLAALPPHDVGTVDAGMTGDDRALLEAGVA